MRRSRHCEVKWIVSKLRKLNKLEIAAKKLCQHLPCNHQTMFCVITVHTSKHTLSLFLPSLGMWRNRVPLLRLIKAFRSQRGTQILVSFCFGRTCKGWFIKPLGNFFWLSRPPHHFYSTNQPLLLWRPHFKLPQDMSVVTWMLSIAAHENICTNSSLGNAGDEALKSTVHFHFNARSVEGTNVSLMLCHTIQTQGLAWELQRGELLLRWQWTGICLQNKANHAERHQEKKVLSGTHLSSPKGGRVRWSELPLPRCSGTDTGLKHILM